MTGPRPNVVFFIVDDTPHEHLGCWDGTVPTPNLDRVRKRGMRFDRAFCASAICQPSRYSYLTGRYAGTCPDPVFLRKNSRHEPADVEFNVYLNSEIPSQGRLFQQAGYRTGFAGKWHVGHPRGMLDVPEFDTEADPADPDVDERLRRLQKIFCREVRRTGGYDFAGGVIWANNGRWPLEALCDHHIEWSTLAALEFLDSCRGDRPFLLHYASTCTHGPGVLDRLDRDWRYTPGGRVQAEQSPMPPRHRLPQRLRRMGLAVDHMNASALWIDDQVGALLDKLEQMGALENTIFIFCADHNIEPGKATCYERGIRVPLLIGGPGAGEGPRTCDAMVQNIDLLPTMLAMCGIGAEGTSFDGTDLTPLLREEAGSVRDEAFFEVGYMRAVRTERWKYIALRFPERVIDEMRRGEREKAPYALDRDRQAHCQIAMEHYPGYYDQDQLYDLRTDPDEQHNLADDPDHAPALRRMKERLRRFVDGQPHPYPVDRQAFLESERFQQLARRTRDVGTEYIPWWNPQ